MWKLVIEDDEGKRTVVPLTRDDYTIGRQEGNTIRLTERNVSREHGRIKRRRNGAPPVPGHPSHKDAFILEDRSSYNGLFVNGLRVAHAQDLQHGDLIQIGDYRIVLQDDAASAIETAAIPVTQTEPGGHDVKATIPMAAAFRGQDLTERPSRFVMLVGPTPGVEYPLDRERLTIGRAEDSSISVNHNSVSRLHCEVHALGDGRYEIVDKGSSNGVRVNAVELKRSIIEAGDVIELGDVRFKFVGAGQVFVPGPNESQQLTAISDREAELADPRRKSWGGYAVPIVLAGVVGAVIILGFVWVLQHSHGPGENGNGPNVGPAPDAEQQILNEAKKLCTPDECEAGYAKAQELGEKSPWRSQKDFRDVESMWADSLIKKAQAQADNGAKRSILERIQKSPTLDADHRARVASMLGELDQPSTTTSALPVATGPVTATTTATTAVAANPPPTATAPKTPTTHATNTSSPSTASQPTSQPTAPATVAKPTTQQTLDKARQAAMAGNPGEVKNLTLTLARGGNSEAGRLAREACKQLHDPCYDEMKSKYPQ